MLLSPGSAYMLYMYLNAILHFSMKILYSGLLCLVKSSTSLHVGITETIV